MNILDHSHVTYLRMHRQFLSRPAGRTAYDSLFRDMSPVPAKYWTEPGSPPTLPLHADFDDYAYNSNRRRERQVLKGRFAGGSIFYVDIEDLEVFACLYRKDIKELSEMQQELLELLEREGPMNIGLMKEITGCLVKDIVPALHRLQEAFIVYEDQVDNEWDRAWYLFGSEFPQIDPGRHDRAGALEIAIPRFARLCVFFDEEMAMSYYRLPRKLVREVLAGMVERGLLLEACLDSHTGYILTEDKDARYLEHTHEHIPRVLLLQRNDFMVRANAHGLKAKFEAGRDILYYLLMDGEFHGAVTGRFRFGPHDVDDIVLDLSEDECASRKNEVIEAVHQVFDPDKSPVRKYCGKDI